MCDEVLDSDLYADTDDCESPYIEDEWPGLIGTVDNPEAQEDEGENTMEQELEDLGWAEFCCEVESLRADMMRFCDLTQLYAAEGSEEQFLALQTLAEHLLFNVMTLSDALGLCDVHEYVVTEGEVM
jgi:hypothetical protein